MGSKPRDWPGQALFRASKRGYARAAKDILAGGANANYRDTCGNTPLMAAVWEGHEDIVKMLLSSGATVSGANQFGFTALVLAVHYQRPTIVRLLLDNGADVNETYRTKDNTKNPLLAAVFKKDRELMALLMSAGADPNILDEAGATIADVANKAGLSLK